MRTALVFAASFALAATFGGLGIWLLASPEDATNEGSQRVAIDDGLSPATAAIESPRRKEPEPREEGVFGVVLRPDGRPASGATVTLYRQVSAWPEWRRDTIESGVSSSNGEFRFETQPGPALLVGFEHPEHAGGVQEAPAALASLTLQLHPGFDVEGVVANEAGLPMANVRVSLESPLAEERAMRTTSTSAAGRFRFANVAPGAMRVVARHELWQPATLPNVVVGSLVRSLELRFTRPALALEGRVVSAATQEPVVGATVLALPPVQRLGRNQPSIARTGADGSFRLAGLAGGVHRVEVRHHAHGIASRTVTVGSGATQAAFELPGRVEVKGRLVADGVAGVAGARLLLRSSADELVVAVAKADGTFAFPSTVTPGAATITAADGVVAFDSGMSALPVEIEEAGAPLEIRAMHPAVVTGRVLDGAGAPIAGARLTATETGMLLDRLSRAGSALLDRDIGKLGDQLTRTAAGEPQPLLAVTDADGAFRVAGLHPGSASLRVSREGFGGKQLQIEVPTCGETAKADDVVLPRGCALHGEARRGGRPVAGVQVGVVVDGVAITAVTGADGRYELRDLPPGEHRVAARYSTFPTVRAKNVARLVEGGEATVDVDLPQGRTIRGVVTGSDGQPVEGALVLLRGEQGNPVMTDSNGAFEVEAPNRDVALVVGQFDRAARRVIDVAAGQERVDVRIEAVRTGAVFARLLGLPGRKPLPGVLVRFLREEGEAAIPSRWFDLDAGALRNPLFPAGRSRVVFWAEGYAPASREVEVGAGKEIDLGDIALEPGCELRGFVRDEAGAPVAGAEAFLGDEADFFEYQATTRSGADGAFVVHGVSSLAANLLVRAPGYAWKSTPLRLPDDALSTTPLEVVLERGSTIEARVEGADAVGSMVVLRRGNRIVATAEVDERGLAVFDNRGPGEYSVQRFGDDRTRVAATIQGSGEVVRVEL